MVMDMNALEGERMAVIDFYKKQLEAYRHIKREIEKVQWADANYDALVSSMNLIGSALSNAISTLSNGSDVYVVDELMVLGRRYLENERKFPRI